MPFPPKTGTNMLHPLPPPIVELVVITGIVDSMVWYTAVDADGPCAAPSTLSSRTLERGVRRRMSAVLEHGRDRRRRKLLSVMFRAFASSEAHVL